MTTQTMEIPAPEKIDYSLTGPGAKRAIALGLAEADWYQSPVSHKDMRNLLARRDGPAIMDTLILFAVLLSSATATPFFGGLTGLLYHILYMRFFMAQVLTHGGTSADMARLSGQTG